MENKNEPKEYVQIGTFLEYRGHTGSIEINKQDTNYLRGRLLNVRREDICFDSLSITDLFRRYCQTVNNYENINTGCSTCKGDSDKCNYQCQFCSHYMEKTITDV